METRLFDEEAFRKSLGIPDELPDPFDNKDIIDSQAIERAFPRFNRRLKVIFNPPLTKKNKKLAVRNALRYFDSKHHPKLAGEFLTELEEHGHIYMYRFCPYWTKKEYEEKMFPFPITDYLKVCKTLKGAAIILMIQNNLFKENAQFPLELITYGSNGAVFQNWIQYRLTIKYLSEMEDDQTLVMYSGHPLGLFHLIKTLQKL